MPADYDFMNKVPRIDTDNFTITEVVRFVRIVSETVKVP